MPVKCSVALFLFALLPDADNLNAEHGCRPWHCTHLYKTLPVLRIMMNGKLLFFSGRIFIIHILHETTEISVCKMCCITFVLLCIVMQGTLPAWHHNNVTTYSPISAATTTACCQVRLDVQRTMADLSITVPAHWWPL